MMERTANFGGCEVVLRIMIVRLPIGVRPLLSHKHANYSSAKAFGIGSCRPAGRSWADFEGFRERVRNG